MIFVLLPVVWSIELTAGSKLNLSLSAVGCKIYVSLAFNRSSSRLPTYADIDSTFALLKSCSTVVSKKFFITGVW